MTLQDAIHHCEDRAKADCTECAKEPEKPEKPEDELADLTEYVVMILGALNPTVLYYAGDGEWYSYGGVLRGSRLDAIAGAVPRVTGIQKRGTRDGMDG